MRWCLRFKLFTLFEKTKNPKMLSESDVNYVTQIVWEISCVRIYVHSNMMWLCSFHKSIFFLTKSLISDISKWISTWNRFKQLAPITPDFVLGTVNLFCNGLPEPGAWNDLQKIGGQILVPSPHYTEPVTRCKKYKRFWSESHIIFSF